MNIINTEPYKNDREYLNKFICLENILKSKILKIKGIPKNYKAILNTYNTDKSEITYLKIYNNDKSISVLRNYHTFNYLYFSHNNKDYLACGEDYQGITIINLTDMTKNSYVPEESLIGKGFCISDFISWNDDTNELYVEGCYWAFPYVKRYYHIKDLDNVSLEEYREIID